MLIKKEGYKDITTERFKKEVCSVCGYGCGTEERIFKCVEDW